MKKKSKQRAPLASHHWMINWSWPNFLCFVKGGCFSCFRLSTCVCVCQLVLLCTNKPIVVQRRSQICLFLERLPDSSILCSPFGIFTSNYNWRHKTDPTWAQMFLKHASRVTPRNIDFQMTLKLQLFSDSVSPAFLIRVGAAMEYSGSGEDEDEEEAKENIYEEIREKSEDNQLHNNQQNETDSRKSSTSSHEVSTTSSTGTTKSRFQKALEAVTRRSSRSLEHNNNNSNKNNNNRERSFHLSISKGRKKNLIDRARINWDCDPQVITTLILKLVVLFPSISCSCPDQTSGMRSRLNKSSNDMLEEVGSCHAKVLSQLKLDVEVISSWWYIW